MDNWWMSPKERHLTEVPHESFVSSKNCHQLQCPHYPGRVPGVSTGTVKAWVKGFACLNVC